MKSDDGGQAFPVPAGTCADGELWAPTEGMSLRDYFAGQALAGLYGSGKYSENTYAWYAVVAYAIAGAMLKERVRDRA